jgi:hypothetical protein
MKGNVEDAVSAGSGTLVTIGSLHCILTAGHVLDALPRKGPVGIVMHEDDPSKFQKQTIEMEHTEFVTIPGNRVAHIGPDVGLLRLPKESIGWIKAKASFYNLGKRRDDVLLGKKPSNSHVDALTGIVHEMTKAKAGKEPRTRGIQFASIFCQARLSALRYLNDYELYYYKPTNDPGFTLPESFQGTSGGSAWRIYVIEKAGKIEVIDRRLIAVPFYESFASDGKREITCHGAKGIYGMLIDEVTRRWPEAAKEQA